jgi:hypothetical protein
LKRAATIVGSIAIVAISTLLLIPRHLVWEQAKLAELIWNRDEAHLFIVVSNIGWSGNELQWRAQIAKSYLGARTMISEERRSVVVVKVTPTAIEKVRAQDTSVSSYYVFENRIYGVYQTGPYAGSVATWVDGRFKRAPEEEQVRFTAWKRPCDLPGCEFTDRDGWSYRCCVLSRTYKGETRFPLELRGRHLDLVVTADGPHLTQVIDLEEEGRTTQRLWEVDSNPRHMGASEYEAFLNQK